MSASPIVAIDSHAHVLRRDAPLVSERHSAPKRDATVDEFVGVLDAHGVSHALLTAPSFYGTDNSLLVDALRRFPDRLRATAIVDPDATDDTLTALRDAGVAGIRFNWVRRQTLPDITDAASRTLLRRVLALGWHVELYLEGSKIASVLPALRDAGVRVVVDHFGSPDPTQGVRCDGFQQVLRGVRAGDTWVKLSAPYRLGGAQPQPYVDALLDAGAQQLVWASDWPFVGYEDVITYGQCVRALESWIDDAPTRRQILVDTPARLFGFADTRGMQRT